MTPEENIKAQALAVGFDAARITTAYPPGHGAQAAAWLAAGMHGAMGYLERLASLREGPASSENLLPGARSVIVVALSYDFRPNPPAPFPDSLASLAGKGEPVLSSPPRGRDASRGLPVDRLPLPCERSERIREGGRGVRPTGLVARYARGTDYHNLMWEKLDALAAGIKREFGPDVRTRGFADSGPLRERELAARAGLGWQGKHTNLISLDLGNWFFLGALLTTLELAPDAPVAGHCGTCTRCLTACPTGAIVAPHTLDARRCISYLTIEERGPIPRDLRPLMGNRIFGCDDCLAACPWNERARTARELRLAARPGHDAPDLLEWLALLADEEAFRAEFRGTPLTRPKRAGLRRNVCVALGNVGGEEAVAGLAEALAEDPSPLVRGHAAWALGEIARRTGSEPAIEALETAGEREADPEVSAEIAAARSEAAAVTMPSAPARGGPARVSPAR